jgi:hypothetical protein
MQLSRKQIELAHQKAADFKREIRLRAEASPEQQAQPARCALAVGSALPTWQRALSVLKKAGLYRDINFGRTGYTRTEYEVSSQVAIGDATEAPMRAIHAALLGNGIKATLERARGNWVVCFNVSNPPSN